MIGLIDRADVYTEHPTTGAYTVLAKAGLRCRMAHVNVRFVTGSADRAEIAALRNLIWEPGYDLPAYAQIEVGGDRWNPVAGTLKALRGPTGAVVYRQCDVKRADNG